jgi:diguanylate cyclase (GGDEF)-like protein
MLLDMPTITLVSFSATAILGLVLCFIWWRERSSALIGWWGVAQLVMSSGIAFAGAAAFTNDSSLVVFGQALMVLSAAIMWMAVRKFEGRQLNPLWVAVWPAGMVIAAATGLAGTFDQRLILACTLLAALNLMAAAEFTRQEDEQLVSRWPAIVLLLVTGTGFLAWMPLALIMPIREVGLVYASAWMPAVILVALLSRIALAFVVLAIIKERQELQQRMFALTDALTGLPNRRALFESAGALAGYGKYLKGDPISVMVFDLDHFKKINDTYGHRLGDRVLQLFASVLSEELDTGSIVGRLGGEEFAAILPGADLNAAAARAEIVRAAFADAAETIDGIAVSSTVSIGVAAHDDIDCDIGALFHRADGALYAAKQAGRNRVQLIGPQEPMQFADTVLEAHVVPPRWFGERSVLTKPGMTRRYRGSGADAA